MFKQKKCIRGNGNSLYVRALRHFEARHWEQTIETIHKALENGITKYDLAEVYAYLGFSLGQINRYPEALEAHQKSVAINPENVTAWRDYGITLRRTNDYAGAENCYEQALALDPTDEKTLASLGTLYIFRDKPQKAIGVIEPAIHDGVESGATFGNLALAMAMVGRFDEADLYLSKAIAQCFPEWREIQQRINDLREYQNNLNIKDTSWLPERCSQCGAALSNETVRWVNDHTIQCGYCGSVNRK